jgi:pyruvyltransferase
MRKKDILNVFWFRRPRPGNFGDILTPLILSHYGYQVNHAMQEDANYMMVGSIAKLAHAGVTVLGSGAMTSAAKLDPSANWRWVRGPRTRKLVINNGGQCPEIYGDPAMLLPRIVAPSSDKKHKLGIVPHYVDYHIVKEQFPNFPVINLLNSDPVKVVNKITSCERIISSSLHGIIAAHAYGIPAAWVEFGNRLSGDGTKFHDHYESLDLLAQISTVDSPVFTVATFDDAKIHRILEDGDF